MNPTAMRHPPCGGLPDSVLVFGPNGHTTSPLRGDAGHFSLPRQRKLTKRKPTLPGAEQSGYSTVVVASYGHCLRLACPTGSKGSAMALPDGFVVRPPIASTVPIRPSAVRGATGHDFSRLTGFVVLSLTASAVIVRSLPFAGLGAAQRRNDGFRGGRGGRIQSPAASLMDWPQCPPRNEVG